MRMKTILFTYDYPFNPERGGIERMADVLAKSLTSRGYEVLYLCSSYPDNCKGYDYPVDLYFLPSDELLSDTNKEFYNSFLEHHKVDIIINHSMFDCFELFLSNSYTNRPKISVIHNKPSFDFDRIYQRRNSTSKEFMRWIARVVIWSLTGVKKRAKKSLEYRQSFIFDNSDIVVLLSEKFKPDFKRFCTNVKDEGLIALPNPNTYSKAKSVYKKKKQVLYVGRIESIQKRPDRLLKVWKKIYKQFPDWELVFVGDGAARYSLERDAEKLERVKIVGFRDPKVYYEESSIFCMTSNFEGFPMVLAEAMVHGVVPIAFNSFVSITDVIEDDKNGLLVKPFSLKKYAEKLSDLMSDNEKRENMAAYAQKYIDRYDVDKIVDRWEALFDSMSVNKR